MKTDFALLANLKQKLIERFGDNISDVILFGSRAKGDAPNDSDYDLLIILKINFGKKYMDEVCHFIYDFEIDHEIFVDMHFLLQSEINKSIRAKQPVFDNAIANGIHL